MAYRAAMPLPDHAEDLRQHDRERFLTTLFAPPPTRESMWILLAFNLEIARIRSQVSEPMLGQIRLQWWREAIEDIYSHVTQGKHPLLPPLAEILNRQSIKREFLDALLDAREKDMDDQPPPDMEALENYLKATVSSLQSAFLHLLGVNDPAAHQAATHAGIAFGLVGIVRACPDLLAQQRVLIPEPILREARLTGDALRQHTPDAHLAALLRPLGERARAHLSMARALHAQIPEAAMPALLPAVLTEHHLKRLEKTGYDILTPRRAFSLIPDGARLWLAARRGRF